MIRRSFPKDSSYVTYDNYHQVAKAIREMVVRGAPAIGVAAGMGIALAASSSKAKNKDRFMVGRAKRGRNSSSSESSDCMENLFWGIDRPVLRKAEAANGTVSEIVSEPVCEAKLMADEDVEANTTNRRVWSRPNRRWRSDHDAL